MTSVLNFIRIRGKIIPIKKSLIGAPDDLQKIEHIKKAREELKLLTKKSSVSHKKFAAIFYKTSKIQSKQVGKSIALKLAQLKKIKKVIL
jgi:hypothetical protein